MTRQTQTNFRAEDFMVGSTKDRPSTKRAAKKAAAPAAPAADPSAVPDGTTEEVLAWVGDDKDRAQKALDKENEGESPRVTLTEPLEKALAPDPDAVPEGSVEDLMEWVGDDQERAQRALDAENAKDKPRKTAVSELEGALKAEDDEAK